MENENQKIKSIKEKLQKGKRVNSSELEKLVEKEYSERVKE